MSAPKMGGPAFPTMYGAERANDENTLFNVANGMTLWDYYAAAAIGGLMAAQVHGFNDQPGKGPFAEMAAGMADAMLAERAKRMEAEP